MAYKYIDTKERVYAKAYKVHSGSASATIDIKSRYPDVDYTKLTSQDFVAGYISDNNIGHSDQSTYQKHGTYYVQTTALSINCSYNPSTGILYVSPSTGDAWSYEVPDGSSSDSFSGLTCEVLMIVDGVRSEYT